MSQRWRRRHQKTSTFWKKTRLPQHLYMLVSTFNRFWLVHSIVVVVDVGTFQKAMLTAGGGSRRSICPVLIFGEQMGVEPIWLEMGIPLPLDQWWPNTFPSIRMASVGSVRRRHLLWRLYPLIPNTNLDHISILSPSLSFSLSYIAHHLYYREKIFHHCL